MDFAQVSKIRLEGKPYDAEVEYLESTGTQWIDTGVVPNQSNTSFELDAAFVGTFRYGLSYPESSSFLGTQSNSNGRFSMNFGNSSFQANYALTWFRKGVADADNYKSATIGLSRQLIRYSAGDVNFGDVSWNTPFGSETMSAPLILFGRYTTANGIETFASYHLRLHGFRMWQSGVLVRDFIPVRKNGVGCFYDKVSGQLFGNQGTGAFLYGSDVRCYSVAKIERGSTTLWKKRPYDAEVEYLESNGTQYIETGLYLQSGDTVSMRASTGAEINECFWSARQANFPRNTNTLFRLGNTSSTAGRFDFGIHSSSSESGIQQIFDFSGWSGIHEYRTVFNNFYIDGVLYATGKNETFTSGSTLHILASPWTDPSITNFFHGKVYSFKVVRNGATILELIPVRLGQVGCLFDKVSGELFGNAGTGSFGYGADLG